MATSFQSAPPAFSVSVQPAPGACIVTATGEIDLTTAPELSAALDEAAAQSQPVIVDLCDVPFCDSSGLRVLLQHCERIAVSCLPEGAVRRTLELSGAASLFPFYASRQAALRAVG